MPAVVPLSLSVVRRRTRIQRNAMLAVESAVSTKLADMLHDSGLDAQESARAPYVLIYLFGSIVEAAGLSDGPKGIFGG